MQGIIIYVHAFILTDYVVFQFPAPLGLYIYIIHIHMSCQTWIDNPGSCWVPSCSTRCTGTRVMRVTCTRRFFPGWVSTVLGSQVSNVPNHLLKRRLKTLPLGYTGKCGGSDSSTIAMVNYTILFILYIYDTPFFLNK